MKKLLLSLSALVILGLPKLTAQIINPDFETWSVDLLATDARDPNSGLNSAGWWDFNLTNSILLGSSPITVFQDSVNPEHGNYCAKIVSQVMSHTAYDTLRYYGFDFPDTNGIIVTAYVGYTGVFNIKTGIPIHGRISNFSFYYRYYPNGTDTSSCSVSMYHWNSTNNTRSLIGGGLWRTSGTTSSWTVANVPVLYDSASAPDTVVILFSACSLFKNPQVNDSLMIDNGTITGIDNITHPAVSASIYPNPANEELSMKVSSQAIVNHIEVYDITGKLVDTYKMNNNFLVINTQAYNTGLYLYKMFDNDGIQVDIGKFSIVR